MKVAYGKKWYTPMDIAKQGLIQNSKGDKSTVSGNYNYVMQLIKSGRLRAKNYSTGKKLPNYLVPADEIERYHNTVTKI